MHQHKVLLARPKIEKGKKFIEPSFTLYLVLTVGPGIQGTQKMPGEHGLEWQDLERLDRRLGTNSNIYHRNKSLLWKSKRCLKSRILRLYSSKSRWRLQEVKKWTRKSTKSDKRSSDIYRINPWKRPRTTRSNQWNILMYKPVLFWKINSKFRLKTSNSHI